MKIVFEIKDQKRIYYLDKGGKRTEIGFVNNFHDAFEEMGMAELWLVAQNNFEAGIKAMAKALGHGDLEIEEIKE